MCKKLVFASNSVPCSLYLFNVMVAHRESPRQVVELRSRTMAPLLHPYPSLAFRWLFIQPRRAGRHKRITLAQITVGSCMKSHTNWSWTLFVIMIWRVMQKIESCDNSDRVDLFVPFFFRICIPRACNYDKVAGSALKIYFFIVFRTLCPSRGL